MLPRIICHKCEGCSIVAWSVSRERKLSHLLLAATLLLVLTAIIAFSDRITTYEISPYDSIPITFWITTTAAYLIFSYVFVRAAKDNHLARILGCLLGLTLLSILLMALPAIRYGTYYTQWDVWFHIGYASSIAQSGHVNLDENFYPSFHFLWVNIAQTTGIGVFDLGVYLAPPLVAAIVPLTYVVTNRIFQDRSIGAIAASLAVFSNGIVGTFPAPWFYSLVLLLLLLAALVIGSSRPNTSTTVLGLLIASSLIISHPLAPVFLIVALVMLSLHARVIGPAKFLAKAREKSKAPNRITVGATFFALVVVVYITWISFLTFALQVSVRQVVASVSSEGIVSPVVYGRFFTVILLLKIYSGPVILGIYWLGGLLILAKSGSRAQWRPAYPAIALALSALVLAVLFQSLVSGLRENVNRPLTVAILALPSLAGLFLGQTFKKLRRDPEKSAMLLVAIAVPFLLALPAAYPSPYIALFNYENTQGVYASIDWAAAYLPRNGEILSNSYIGRYAYALQARDQAYEKLFHFDNTLPSNLTGYISPSKNHTYFIIDRETVEVASLDLRAWNSPSARMVDVINKSPGIVRLYDDGDVEIYLSGLG